MVSEDSHFAQRVEELIRSSCVEVDCIRMAGFTPYAAATRREEWIRGSTLVCVVVERLVVKHWRRIHALQGHVERFPLVHFLQKGTPRDVVQAMQRGALNVLVAPFTHADVMRAINAGLDHGARLQSVLGQQLPVLERLGNLTNRQRQVITLLVSGLPHREIAAELGISPKTLDVHRSKIMARMEVGSFAELVTSVVRVHGFSEPERGLCNPSNIRTPVEGKGAGDTP